MRWIAPPEKDPGTTTLERRLWDAADQLRANSGLNSQQYSQPVLGLIFLRFAEARFMARRLTLETNVKGSRRGSRLDDPPSYHAEGVLYLAPEARFEHLLALPEQAQVGKALNEAMKVVERDNPELKDVLPRSYQIFGSVLLKDLLKRVSEIPANLEYDAFGRIYEYFLGEFARTEGQKGGEFFTPSSHRAAAGGGAGAVPREDPRPACGSGGMFVQSARFVAEHQKNPASELSIHGQEKVEETVRLCRMNLAMHGLEGDIRQAIQLLRRPARSRDRFDFVIANPPFNVNAVDKERLEGERATGSATPSGCPARTTRTTSGSSSSTPGLNARGRAGFIMANSASDAGPRNRRSVES